MSALLRRSTAALCAGPACACAFFFAFALSGTCNSRACACAIFSTGGLGQVVDEAVAGLGRLDVLVNNAGIIRRAPALEFSEADWDDVLHINLKAPFFLAQAAGRVMAAQGRGKIINIASMLSFQGGILVPSYTAAKSGVAGLTRALANEWAAARVNVNAIAPGYMATDNTAALRADLERSASILGRIPAGRWGTPQDLQGLVVFLRPPPPTTSTAPSSR